MKSGLILMLLILVLSLSIFSNTKIDQVKSIIPEIDLKYQTPFSLPKGWVYVLVQVSLFDEIETSLHQYATDLESIDGFSVAIYSVSTTNTTLIRSFLQTSLPGGLAGCLLVGNVPEPYYEWMDWEFSTFVSVPTDFYYMDLDGEWIDTDNNTAYDKHSGETSAEIWVGTLQPWSDYDQAQVLRNYFQKNHLYRTGELVVPKRALLYLDLYDFWGEEFYNSTKIAYDDVVLVNDDETTIKSDYMRRLQEGYEWIYLATHGAEGLHTFEINGQLWGGTVYARDYRRIDPHTFFYVLDACYTTADIPHVTDSIAGSAVFGTSYGLLAIGPRAVADSDLQTHLYRTEFYEALSEGKCMGEAYLEDIKIYEDLLAVDPEYKIPEEEYHWTIVGDPSLRINYRMAGDVYFDGTIDINDLVVVASAFDSTPGSILWNEQADLCKDGIIDIFDLIIIAINFGKTWVP